MKFGQPSRPHGRSRGASRPCAPCPRGTGIRHRRRRERPAGKHRLHSEGRVEFELGEEMPQPKLRDPPHLLLAIFKFDRMEWAIEKCTELGVSRIVPFVARRTDAHLASAAGKTHRDAGEGSLSRRPSNPDAPGPPEIAAPTKLRERNEHDRQWPQDRACRDGATNAATRYCSSDSPGGEIVLAIGPEGGWTDDELEIVPGRTGWALRFSRFHDSARGNRRHRGHRDHNVRIGRLI